MDIHALVTRASPSKPSRPRASTTTSTQSHTTASPISHPPTTSPTSHPRPTSHHPYDPQTPYQTHHYPVQPQYPPMHLPYPPQMYAPHPSSLPAKRPAPPHPAAPSAKKKQTKWTPDEDAAIIELRGNAMKWEDISKNLPGRSAISCRLRFQNYLERRSEWTEEKKDLLARLYERFKREMWEKIAREMQCPWRAAEAMHWQLGEGEMASRANVSVFHLAGQQQQQQQQTNPSAGQNGAVMNGQMHMTPHHGGPLAHHHHPHPSMNGNGTSSPPPPYRRTMSSSPPGHFFPPAAYTHTHTLPSLSHPQLQAHSLPVSPALQPGQQYSYQQRGVSSSPRGMSSSEEGLGSARRGRADSARSVPAMSVSGSGGGWLPPVGEVLGGRGGFDGRLPGLRGVSVGRS